MAVDTARGPARALVTGPGGDSWQGEGTEVRERPGEEMPGPGEGPGRKGATSLRRSSAGGIGVFLHRFHTQSPTNSNHITQHVVRRKLEHLITLSAFSSTCDISPGSPVSAQEPSPLRAGQLSAVVTEARVTGCRLESLTHGPAMTVGQAGASAYVFPSLQLPFPS